MMLDKELLKRIQKEAFASYVNYEVVGGNENETYIPADEIKSMLKDLLNEMGGLREEYEYQIERLKKELREAKQPTEEEDHHEDYILMKAGLI